MPQDVDLLVIGAGSEGEIRAEADIATRKLGRDVNATVLTPAEWDAAESGFIAHVKDGPLVELNLKQ